jgi:hypothetical protein
MRSTKLKAIAGLNLLFGKSKEIVTKIKYTLNKNEHILLRSLAKL